MPQKFVYLDNATTTKVDPRVVEAMIPYFSDNYGLAISDYSHSFGMESREILNKSRETVAKSINADAEEVIFTSGGTESNNLALIGTSMKHKKGHIITSKIEHSSILNTCKYLEKQGFKVTYLDVDREGFVNLDQLQGAIKKETFLVSIQHANQEVGMIQDIGEIGKICKENYILFHIDGIQSFTKIPIDVKKMNIDLLSLSAHKIHGPKGVGGLFIRKGTEIESIFQGGDEEFRLRAGTENIPGIVGFVKAVSLSKEDDVKKMARMRDNFIEKVLKEIPNTMLLGSKEKRLCNNMNFSFKHVEGESIVLYLDMEGIAISTGSACSSKKLKPSHVLDAMGFKEDVSHASVRISLSRFNTDDEMDYTFNHLKNIIKKLRGMSPFK